MGKQVEVIRLTLPLPPPSSANSRGHWRVGYRKLKAYRELLDTLLYVRHIVPPPAKPIMPALIATDLYLHNFMDDDNAANRLKPLWDWLRRNGYISNDSRKHLRHEGYPNQEIDRKRPRVELTIRKDTGRR